MINESGETVYRLKIQPGGTDKSATPYDFCKEEGIIGIGWGYNHSRFEEQEEEFQPIDEISDTEAAVARHREIEDIYVRRKDDDYTPSRTKNSGELRASLRYMIKEAQKGDLVWVNEGSEFAVCRIVGDWETDLDQSPQKQNKYARNDIRNFRNAEWKVVPYTMVPGFVKRRFAGQGSTLSKMRISGERKSITRYIFAIDEFDETTDGLAASVASKLQSEVTQADFFGILGPDEVEDVVLMKLQSNEEGWSIIKSTTNSSEADIECEVRRVRGGEIERAFLQVKSGKASVSPTDYEEKAQFGHVFLFAETPLNVSDQENMSEITPEEVFSFAQNHTGLLPDPVLLKLEAYL